MDGLSGSGTASDSCETGTGDKSFDSSSGPLKVLITMGGAMELLTIGSLVGDTTCSAGGAVVDCTVVLDLSDSSLMTSSSKRNATQIVTNCNYSIVLLKL